MSAKPSPRPDGTPCNSQLAASTIWLCADFFYGLYTLVLAFALGRFCLCCKCCCDDEDDCVYDY